MVEGLDLEAVLAPLAAGEGGAGEDLRGDYSPGSPYQKLRDARAEARAEERTQDAAGESDSPAPQAWREVKRLGLLCLAEKSKDFEVAAWLAEALVRLDGLPGLIDATRIIDGLLERYWEPGFPQPDEDGLDGRGAPLGGLSGDGADGTVMQPLRRLPLFRRTDGQPVGLHLWQVAEDTAAIPEDSEENKKRRANRFKAGVPELATLQAEAKADAATLRRVAGQARTATRAWQAMDARMNERFGAEAPATRRVREALERMLEIGERLIGAVPEDAPAPAAAEAEVTLTAGTAAEAAAEPATAGAGARRALRTREDAIVQLEELAEFFRKTEPHSPLAYTLDHAVRRARMPLPDLLAEVLPDAASRQAMLTMLGIRTIDEAAPGGSG
jgi:type VI secretion system protein ImpA